MANVSNKRKLYLIRHNEFSVARTKLQIGNGIFNDLKHLLLLEVFLFFNL